MRRFCSFGSFCIQTSMPIEFLVLGGGLVAHDCGYPLSRYTCRATRVAADVLDFIAFCRCSSGVAPHPLKILVSHLSPPHSREVSHRNLGLKRCRATRGGRRYSCELNSYGDGDSSDLIKQCFTGFPSWGWQLSGLPDANAKSLRFSYAISNPEDVFSTN